MNIKSIAQNFKNPPFLTVKCMIAVLNYLITKSKVKLHFTIGAFILNDKS